MISRLYFATPSEISNDALEGEVRFRRPLFESGKILCVFRQTRTDRIVHEIRNGTLGLGGLVTECLVDLRRKIYGGPLWLNAHTFTLASRRFDVKLEDAGDTGRLD